MKWWKCLGPRLVCAELALAACRRMPSGPVEEGRRRPARQDLDAVVVVNSVAVAPHERVGPKRAEVVVWGSR